MIGKLTPAVLDAQYANSFGRIAGYLPKDRRAVDAWLADLAGQAQDRKEELSPAVAALKQLIATDKAIEPLVSGMLGQLPRQLQPVRGIDHLLVCVDQVITTAPEFKANPDERILFPLSALFAPFTMTQVSAGLFRLPAFNTALQNVLKAWCAFLDSPQSRNVLTEASNGWLSAKASEQNKLDEYEIPDRTAEHWGFASFNDYFHRRFKAGARPVAADPRAVVASVEGTVVRIEHNVGAGQGLPLKGQSFALADVLNHGPYTEQFTGGHVIHTVLSATGYHRWHAPVDGVVRRVETVPCQVFSVAETTGVLPTAQQPSPSAEAAASTRGLIYIESTTPDIGMVCVVPIGNSEMSSVTITVREGQYVSKGDELGYFSYGGSTHALVFQRGNNPLFDAAGRGKLDEGKVAALNTPVAWGS
ncbi:phophatidylserine decarboxylase associated domain-containing protein [Streptomyces violascens]|uniref:phophatidylserine decarboxylase associated domain-containing protein n=1 Tax=Streptomyces violascens TaxID=67381 RepID=UPI00364B4E59